MDRIELVKNILLESEKLVLAVTSYEEKPRNYADGDTLFMREVHFLVAIGPDEHPTMSEMAQRLYVTQGAVTQTAMRLEKKGYIVRRKDTIDKRLTTVSLTEKGKAACMKHILYDQAQFLKISEELNNFSDNELERFLYLEQRIRELFIDFK